MPGILPMKVIRVGNSAQSRVAQACDRCRSKKIRCDGIRPQCSQCSNVGFECKTSDKLSRRAFPRGYTESLEDRVRALETEIRELKDLLDKKDEKIDVLSRIHSFSSPSRRCSASLSPEASERVKTDASAEKEVIQVETCAPIGPSIPPSSQSCTSALIDTFARKVRESGRSHPEIRVDAFKVQAMSAPASPGSPKPPSEIPPRLLSDQYINIFFQEWAPLLPVLHRPTFLQVYERYVADPEAEKWHGDKQAVAQLFLIFDIAALSSASRFKQSTTSHEAQWRKAIQPISSTVSISTVQCHLLAQLYYLLNANYTHVARHRATAVNLCQQLGLHHSQKYHVMNCLESETHKKVFWCQYVMDKFMSASSGTPTLLRDCDISTEYPADVDDENLTEKGFSSSSACEITKLSSALALFKVCRILSRALDQLLPASASYRFSIENLHSVSDELDRWLQSIPEHLRMKFLNDKPSTGVISDRSPLLSLAYFFIRNLIHRPLVYHGSGSGASASLMVIADSAKHVVQILELLEERRMNYSFPIDKTDLLLSCGFSLLWQCLELSPDSKLVIDNQKSLRALANLLTRDSLSVAIEFLRVAHSLVTLDVSSPVGSQSPPRTTLGFASDRISMPAPGLKRKSARRQLQAIASRFSSLTKPHQTRVEDVARKATIPEIGLPCLSSHGRSSSRLNLFSTQSLPVFPVNSPATTRAFIGLSPSAVNLDYLPLGKDRSSAFPTPPWKEVAVSPNVDSTKNMEGTDNSSANTYGGLPNDVYQEQISQRGLELEVNTFADPQERLDEEWCMSAIDSSAKAPAPQSLLSGSEDSITSGGEEFSGYGSNNSSATSSQFNRFNSGSKILKRYLNARV